MIGASKGYENLCSKLINKAGREIKKKRSQKKSKTTKKSKKVKKSRKRDY